MVSWAWCIVRNAILYLDHMMCCMLNSNLRLSVLKLNRSWKFHRKLKCELHVKCVAYTFEQLRLSCILHGSTDKGQKYIRGKQTGVKKTDYILSLPQISYCFDKNRQKRCRREPNCHHVNCLRNAQDFHKLWKNIHRGKDIGAKIKKKGIWCWFY